MIRRRARAAGIPGGPPWNLPLVVLLLLTLFLITASATPSLAQTTWLFSQTPVSGDSARSLLNDRTIDNSAAPSDPIPAGSALQDLVVNEVKKIQAPDNGGIAIDRYRGRVWTTNGDRNNLVFVSVPCDPNDPQGKEIVSNIAGTYPFSSNITSITIMYGYNGRPKFMWCTAWAEYSYINMRGDTWTWAPVSQKKQIPNGGFPVTDIAFAVVDTRVGSGPWTTHPAIVATESTGVVYGWDAFNPQGLMFTTGVGLFNVTGVAIDTSQPVTVLWDGQNDRRLSGRILCFGERDGKRWVKDADGRTRWEVSGLGTQVLGMAYSAETTDLSQFLVGSSSAITAEVTRAPQSPKQPVMRLAPGERQVIRLEANTAMNLRGYRAFFFANLNRVPLDPSLIGLSEKSDIAGVDLRVRGRYDSALGRFRIDLDPALLPASPIPFDQQFYLYGRWVFVPQELLGSTGNSGSRPIEVSDPIRIAYSNAQ